MRTGTRVILNQKSVLGKDLVFAENPNDKYNPFDCKGTVLTTDNPDPRGWRVIVLWDNGFQNTYEGKKNLIIVDDEVI
jgi:hypothetical protein